MSEMERLELIAMIEEHRRLVNTLHVFLHRAYAGSAADRKKLHTIEWDSEWDSPSILDEVEVLAGTVSGVATKCLKRKPKNTGELVDVLVASSISQSELLIHWLVNHGDDFPRFLGYILAIEGLRTSTIDYLKKV